MSLGLKKNGPLGFVSGAGGAANVYDHDQNTTILEAAFGTGQNNLTAHAGGGQASGTPITAGPNRVTTVGTAGDSCLLPATTNGAGAPVIVRNDAGVNSLNVFPATGDAINALAANASFAVAAGKSAIFIPVAAGQWITVLSA